MTSKELRERFARRPIPEAEWYYILNDANELIGGGPFGPGKANALRDLRRMRRERFFESMWLVPENDIPGDANWYPE